MNLSYLKEQKAIVDSQQITGTSEQLSNEWAIDMLCGEVLGDPVPEFEQLARDIYVDDLSR